MTINGTEIDFSKQRGYFFNMDCMEALKQMPDKSVSLAIVDPPYGAGFTEGGGCQGWFSKYHQSEEKSSQFCKVERERERETGKPWNRFGGRFDRYKNLENLGQDKVGGNFDRYKKDHTLHIRNQEVQQELQEQAGLGRRNTQKNHFVGHSPGKRILSRAFSCLTESNNLGRELF